MRVDAHERTDKRSRPLGVDVVVSFRAELVHGRVEDDIAGLPGLVNEQNVGGGRRDQIIQQDQKTNEKAI